MLEIRLWGAPEVVYDGRPWPMRVTAGCWSLLALLVTQRRPLLRASVAPLLWPDALNAEALANLRRHVYLLNRTLPPASEPWIVADAKTVAWNPRAGARIDVVEFETLVSQRRDREAVELYTGDLLASSFDEAVVEARERLRTAYLEALERLLHAARSEGDLPAALRYAELLLAADEWREDAVRAVMAVRYEKGDRSGAIALYERFSEALRRELRVAPMQETTALRDAILSGAPLPEDAPKLQAADRDAGVKFVGRTVELQMLRNGWLRAARGRGTTVLLAGEPGIGKSRLARELAAFAESQGGSALVGRTSSPEAGAFQPVIEALRDGLTLLSPGDVEDAWLAPLLGVLPEVARLSQAPLAPAETLDVERARVRLREALVRLAAAMARRRPLAIVLEDIHWARRATIELIETLAHRVSGHPVLLVVTYRPGELGAAHAIHTMRRELQHARRGQTISLARLDEAELVELARGMLGGERPATELLAKLRRMSEGNPLFAVQALRHLTETGELPSDEQAAQSVASTVASRLSRMAPAARALAQVAATIGGDFTIEEIANVGGWDETNVLEALGLLLDARIVCERGGERFAYGFTHALIEAAIRDAAGKPAERRLRHHRIAQVLAATRAHDPTAAALIAAHWEAAGERELAALAWLRAADVAMQRYEWTEAARIARRALELGIGGERRFDALHSLVESTLRGSDPRGVADDVRELEELANQLGVEQRVKAMILLSRQAQFLGDRDDHQRAVDALMALAEEAGNDGWRACAHLSRAKLHFLSGLLPEAETDARRSLDLASAAGDVATEWNARQSLVQNLFRQGKFDAAMAEVEVIRAAADRGTIFARETLAIAMVRLAVATQEPAHFERAREVAQRVEEEFGDFHIGIIARNELAYDLHQRWDTAGARKAYLEASEMTKEHGFLQLWITSLINLGCIEREVGHLDRARTLWAQARPVAKRLKIATSLACCDVNEAELALVAGDAQTALEKANSGAELARQSGSLPLQADAASVVGAALCATGDVAAGLAHMREGVELRRSLGGARWLANELCWYLEALLAAGDLDAAAPVARELHVLYERQPERQLYPGPHRPRARRVRGALGPRAGGATAARIGTARRGKHAAQARRPRRPRRVRRPETQPRAAGSRGARDGAPLSRLASARTGRPRSRCRRATAPTKIRTPPAAAHRRYRPATRRSSPRRTR